MSTDRYENFDQLRANNREGDDFQITTVIRPSPVLVLAPHGGGIERGTSEIARAVAGEEYGFYCFEGRKREHNNLLHITSTAFDEPRCEGMLKKARIVLAIHGLEAPDPRVWLGGRDTALVDALALALAQSEIESCCDNTAAHGGTHLENLCNRGASGRGCQMEIGLGLRRALFGDVSTRRGRAQRTGLFGVFVAAIRQALGQFASEAP